MTSGHKLTIQELSNVKKAALNPQDNQANKTHSTWLWQGKATTVGNSKTTSRHIDIFCLQHF